MASLGLSQSLHNPSRCNREPDHTQCEIFVTVNQSSPNMIFKSLMLWRSVWPSFPLSRKASRTIAAFRFCICKILSSTVFATCDAHADNPID